MNAIHLDRFGAIVFTPAEVPGNLREPICEELGGRIVEGVRLDLPDDFDTWLDQVLTVARDDENDYRIFKSARDVVASFVRTGRDFHLISSATALRSFLTELRDLNRIAADTDQADTDEAWAEITRDLGGIRLHAIRPAASAAARS